MPVFEWGEHGQPVEKTPTILAPSVTIAAGAIQVNLTGGNPREVGEAVEIGVLRGLRAAGVMP